MLIIDSAITPTPNKTAQKGRQNNSTAVPPLGLSRRLASLSQCEAMSSQGTIIFLSRRVSPGHMGDMTESSQVPSVPETERLSPREAL